MMPVKHWLAMEADSLLCMIRHNNLLDISMPASYTELDLSFVFINIKDEERRRKHG